MRSVVTLLFALSCALFVCVNGHAVLISPPALNSNPSKAASCGGATVNVDPVVTWKSSDTPAISWRLVAGDGAGIVTAYVDTKGGFNNFPSSSSATLAPGIVQLNVVGGTNPTKSDNLGVYTYTLTGLDGIDCSGAVAGTCTLQVASLGSGWYSCASVNITNCADCTITPVAQKPYCAQQVTGLNFCTSKNRYNVLIPQTTNVQATLASLDAQAQIAWSNNLNNTNVFTAGTDISCRADYKQFLCDMNFPQCPGTDGAYTGPYAEECQNVLTACALNPKHDLLYNCSSYPLQNPLSSTTSSFSSFSIAVVTLGALMFILFA